MSLIPHYQYPSALDVFEDPFFHHGLEPRFGVGILPNDLLNQRGLIPRSGMHHLPTGYRRPWALARQAAQELAKDQKNLHFGKDGFQAAVDVHHFLPSEITVKTVNNTVMIEGKHEEREDGHGSVERRFVRKYVLPEDYDMQKVHSSLSSDGVLTIKAPPPAAIERGERHVPINHTNMPSHRSLRPSENNQPHAGKSPVPNNQSGKSPMLQAGKSPNPAGQSPANK